MALYVLYPTKPDGIATGFAAGEYPNDAGAIAGAEQLLGEHDSAAKVEVWEARRHVATRRRRPAKV